MYNLNSSSADNSLFCFPDFVFIICNVAVLQASDLDGEIDLSTCYNVTEYQAQRNYGFQIHVSPNHSRTISDYLCNNNDLHLCIHFFFIIIKKLFNVWM